MMNPFMKKAIELAAENVRKGGQPFGAVLVKDGKIIAEGVNGMHLKYDISAHAEMIAIRKAQEEFETLDLSGCEMYASGHPCPMCYTAMRFAGITDIYFCANLEDCANAGLATSGQIYSDLEKPNEDRKVSMKHIKLSDDMEDPMKLWVNRKS